MSIKRFLYNNLIPPGIIKIYTSLTKKSKQSNRLSINPENERFKNIHDGERCFILASGPSINEQNLKPLKNEHCIAVSSFFHHPDINIIEPKYHVLAPLHPPFNFEEATIVINGLNSNYDYPVDLFVGTNMFPYSYTQYLEGNKTKHNIYPINYEGSIQIDDNNKNDEDIWDISKNPFAIRTVVFSAIQIAVYMGFKEIYLLGCDHDFLKRIGQTEGRHFYESSRSFSDEKLQKSFNLERLFLGHYLTWKAYRNIKEHVEEKGIKIYNSTKGGMLDVFERKELSFIFNK